MPGSKNMDIIDFDWSPDGKLLAMAGYDAIVRVWTCAGDVYMEQPHHKVKNVNRFFAAIPPDLRFLARRILFTQSGFPRLESGY